MDKEQRVTKSYRETSLFVILVSIFFGYFQYFFIGFAKSFAGDTWQYVFSIWPLAIISLVFLVVPFLAAVTNLFQPSKSLSQLASRLLFVYFGLLILSFLWHR